jgi:large subunit ribosomal protein L4
MASAKVYNFTGTETGDITLSDAVFALPANDTLLHQVAVAIAANQRVSIAHTKDRSERAGSGRKPWKQKGTGRARSGSVRSPLWRKGGVTFGPTSDRNFSQKVNQKMRRKATAIALSEKLRSGKLVIVEAFDFSDKKTKLFASGLEALKLTGKGVLVSFTSEEKSFEGMTRNIPRVEHALAENISVADLLNREYVLVTRAGIAQLEARLTSETN